MQGYITADKYGNYTLTNENGKNIYYQTDWDFPALAQMFGYVPCNECGTDGTIDCEHKTATQMIREAQEFLDDEPYGEIDPELFEVN